ncbi:E3 ubiquitin-protein ligase MIB2-like [Centruroides sculpturatus]|uniref:E3 ubiquitin-protein ligase MIB2-like n=1 Tax=Centruroides sculpturatus TaxID=218467 RepID=UPI000C6D7210|nr:E3 ubiquitin-protein ligase MIB2-like [Centruroides sculpturatus]
MDVGLRVVRGPDWKWQNQDDGEGHVGTVVEIGKPGSTTSPDKTVVVQWDSGSRTNYRIGYQGAYDLRVFDNAPIGIKHPNIICDACRKHGIAGMRWKCNRCYDFDLCTQCYMSEKHDLTHPFLRLETTASAGVEMPKRQGTLKIQARGIFVGAKVMRGPDWDWGNQDGGEGKTGKVIDIRGWDNESGRSVANVTWTSGSTNVYRLGHKGKVDLKYIQDSPGGYYFRDHLPILGQTVEAYSVNPSAMKHQFNVGDKVKVLLDVEKLKVMQEGHGGWNPRMAEVSTCYYFVLYLYLNKLSLMRVVRNNLQDSYGDSALHDAIGKENVEIIDLLINVPEIDFSLKNKRGFNVLHHAALKGNNFATERLLAKTRQIVDVKKDDGFAALHLAALNGHYQVAETLLTQGQSEVDIRNNRKQTPLLLAVSQGHCSLIELLVRFGANINAEDEDGDTGMHLALMKQKSEVDIKEAQTISGIVEHLNGQGLEKCNGFAIACFIAQEGGKHVHKNHKGKTPLELLSDNHKLKELLLYYSSLNSAQAHSIARENGDPGSSAAESNQTESDCLICCEMIASITFDPCGHTVTCEDCCVRMKKCIACQESIHKKIGPGGRVISSKVRQASAERLRYLENKIQEIEEAHSCSICMERRRNIAFLCGHGACISCAQTLKICHMCRKPITKKINLY